MSVEADREIAVRQALVASFAIMRRLQRNIPDLDATDQFGRSVVVDAHVTLLLDAVPLVTALDVAAAVRAHMTASPFFPAPAELIEQVRQGRRQRAVDEVEHRKALPPGPMLEGIRQEALATLSDIIANLNDRMRPTRARSAATIDEEVARLRAETERVKGEIRRRAAGGEAIETLAIEYGVSERAARIIVGGLHVVSGGGAC